jgi:hypothetical protein
MLLAYPEFAFGGALAISAKDFIASSKSSVVIKDLLPA